MEEFEGVFDDESEFEMEAEYFEEFETDGPFDEATEMELAAELLTITDDQELEQFIGKVFKRATRSVGKFLKSKAGRALGKIVKGVAKKALPLAGGALGSFIPIPGVGTALGTAAGNMAAGLLGNELEFIPEDELELEVAKKVVKIAGTAAQKAASAPPTAKSTVVAKKAMAAAVKQHAPNLTSAASASTASRRTGKWIRRGRKIVLMGV